jgi:chemotaxis protein histidine kinase CheA
LSTKTIRIKEEIINHLFEIAGNAISYQIDAELVLQSVLELRSQGIDVHEDIADSLRQVVSNSKTVSEHLVKTLMEATLVPLSSLFNRFPGIVKDLAYNQGKEINFLLEGEEILVHKNVVDKMGDPMIHILRNAVDHGMETPDQRINVGKDPKGCISVLAHEEEDSIVFSIHDDGRGLNFEKIIAKAIAMGVVSESQSKELDRSTVASLIFHPGLSTSAEVTNISGRGVGMDVVKKNLDDLGSQITIDSESGQGTTLEISVPKFSLVNIVNALIVYAQGCYYAIPVKNVSKILRFPSSSLETAMQKPIINHDGKPLNIYPMESFLEHLRDDFVYFPESEQVKVVLLENQGTVLGLVVDEFLGTKSVAIKQIDWALLQNPGLLGVAAIGKGKLASVINPDHFVRQDTVETPEEGVGSAEQTLASSSFEGVSEFEAVAEDDAEDEEKAPKRVVDAFEPHEIDILEDVLANGDDLITQLNRDMQSLEGEPDQEVYETLFRNVHTLKAAFGALGMGTLVNAINAGEEILHLLRTSVIEPSETLVALLYQLFNVVDHSFSDLRSGFLPNRNIAPLIRSLEEFKAEVSEALGPVTMSVAPVVVDRDTVIRLNCLQALSQKMVEDQGLKILEIFLSVAPDLVMQNIHTIVLITQLFSQGRILATVPAVDHLENSDEYEAFKILFATDKPEDEIKTLLWTLRFQRRLKSLAYLQVQSLKIQRNLHPLNPKKRLENLASPPQNLSLRTQIYLL